MLASVNSRSTLEIPNPRVDRLTTFKAQPRNQRNLNKLSLVFCPNGWEMQEQRDTVETQGATRSPSWTDLPVLVRRTVAGVSTVRRETEDE